MRIKMIKTLLSGLGFILLGCNNLEVCKKEPISESENNNIKKRPLWLHPFFDPWPAWTDDCPGTTPEMWQALDDLKNLCEYHRERAKDFIPSIIAKFSDEVGKIAGPNWVVSFKKWPNVMYPGIDHPTWPYPEYRIVSLGLFQDSRLVSWDIQETGTYTHYMEVRCKQSDQREIIESANPEATFLQKVRSGIIEIEFMDVRSFLNEQLQRVKILRGVGYPEDIQGGLNEVLHRLTTSTKQDYWNSDSNIIEGKGIHVFLQLELSIKKLSEIIDLPVTRKSFPELFIETERIMKNIAHSSEVLSRIAFFEIIVMRRKMENINELKSKYKKAYLNLGKGRYEDATNKFKEIWENVIKIH